MSKLIVNHLGYGFINLGNTTIFIPKQYMNGAKNGDLVEYEIKDETKNVAQISKILSSLPEYAYVSHIWKGDYIIKTESKKQLYFNKKNYDLNIGDSIKIKGDKVLFNFGNKDNFQNKIKYIKDKYNINSILFEKPTGDPVVPEDFDILKSEESRQDLTDLYTFTIDPNTSKDFDDAISINEKSYGYELMIHIADVSHYIKHNSTLDNFAKSKMNTVYLNGDTIHMLPTGLSNNLCSLVPNEVRNTVSVITKFNKNGGIINYDIVRSKIKSNKRYTYDEVREQINNLSMDNNIRCLYNFITSKYDDILNEFNLSIVNIDLLDNKTPSCIKLEPYDMAHIMIEKCMILANEIVAEELNKRDVVFPYRCHPKPNIDQEEKYNEYKKFSENPIYQEVIRIKSFKNAYYSSNNISHFGLSSNKYCHFTSPIRRYIDIIVHRILLNEHEYSKEELEEICKNANELETNSFKAENELLEMQKDYLINENKGEKSAIIMDVTKYGITVELLDYMTERTIHISKLSKNRLTFDEDNKKLFNEEITYKIGDIINVDLN